MVAQPPSMIVDPTFQSYFKCLKQVFLYITDRCNLRCQYCLYKPNLDFHPISSEIEADVCKKLLVTFRQLGASKLSLIGGEPTQYMNKNYKALDDIIRFAKDVGYEYVRLDTNGFFDTVLLDIFDNDRLDEISFSFDSHISEINDKYRGEGSFQICTDRIREAINKGFNVDVTACVHKGTIGQDDDGIYLADKFIRYISRLGVMRINFHPIFRMGVPRDTWIENLEITPEQWMDLYSFIKSNIAKDEYDISVRIPRRYISREQFNDHQEYYNYCPVKLGERVLVHPNGIIRTCALLIGTPYGMARYTPERIEWDNTRTNETTRRSKIRLPCMNQSVMPEDMVPLCISFKSMQDEFIWKKKLRWDLKRENDELQLK